MAHWAALGVVLFAASCASGAAATGELTETPAGTDTGASNAGTPRGPGGGTATTDPDGDSDSDGTPGTAPASGGTADVPIAEIPVTGDVEGLWDGASLTLRLQGTGVDDQQVTLTANGAFHFELPEGTPFAAVIDADPELHTCSIRNHVGRAWQGTVPIQISCAGPAVQIELSNPDGFQFDPTARSYDLAYSFLTDEQQLRVVGAAGLDAALDGAPVALGAWSTIPLGDAPVTHSVRVGAGGISLSFQFTFRGRSRAIAQAVYVKSPFARDLDEFGSQVALSPDTLVVASERLTFFSGTATVFRRTGAAWAVDQIVSSPDRGLDDFGSSVAISGDTVVVGARFSDRVVRGSGTVYIYRRGFLGWALEAALAAPNPDQDDGFGTSVAITGDTLVVGAPGEDSAATGVNGTSPGPDDNSRSASGAAYVFRRSGTSWTQEAYLKASNTGANDSFGHSVTISGDTIAVGATGEGSAATGVNGTSPGRSDNSMASAGAVYVFGRSGTNWAQEAYIKAANPGASDAFGDSIALSGDTLVVGASGEDSGATGVDGSAPGPDDGSKPDSGAVYVFRRTAGAWAQEAYLKASNTGTGDGFGASVAIWNHTVVVGARLQDSGAVGVDPVSPGPEDKSKADSGAVYVFQRGATWVQAAYVKSANSDAGDWFGSSVAIGPDTIAVGAPRESSGFSSLPGDNSAFDAGAAYLFR